MSHEYTIRCKTCNEDACEPRSPRDEIGLRHLLNARMNLQSGTYAIEHGDSIDFIIQHKHHDLIVWSEFSYEVMAPPEYHI